MFIIIISQGKPSLNYYVVCPNNINKRIWRSSLIDD